MPYPYSPYYNPYVQPQKNFDWVQGEAAAKSYAVAPNSSVILMDSERSRFYLKSADPSGMPMPLRTFEFREVKEVPQVAAPDYVTREEFERRLKEMLKEEPKNE